ncbi:5-(carboxyamino)imidazole ribonucleotide synthase [Thermobrachium celere]|uniref:N5-carboxyaminoimidazole ribonucleotide synthase n=1 Tax=Thermobrachium celere DSM 8682 TaxID=941824 RepID=R7RV75_9CLOT|nr:5-(carboxyamino)imidazole ribonucleotide synthase [Thermobrachium celere]CDF59483.1 Phosphoribosylaminoimidazole carboxylase ATPase subunit [Thermobrachium celere DSM 8682]
MKRIGIVGGGQLGRMLSFEAKRMGFEVVILDPTSHSPASQVSDFQIVSRYDDLSKIDEFIGLCDVITYEFEHISVEFLREIEKRGGEVIPSSNTLQIIQNKLKQKLFLKEKGFNVPKIYKKDEIDKIDSFPCMLKFSRGGYDGKGNILIESASHLKSIVSNIKDEFFIEELIDFEKEISILVARNKRGEVKHFSPVENIHKNRILHISISPARIDKKTEDKIYEIADRFIETIGDFGIYCIEMFLDKKGRVYINEIAPRPHNSGHHTIESCITSQFEQHIRSILNLPLGSTRVISKAVMRNILGDKDIEGDYYLKNIEELLNIEGLFLHLYGKKDVKRGRKMGHITYLCDDLEEGIKRLSNMEFEFIGGC